MKKIEKAIKEAEHILPGKPAPDGQEDPRWQAIIKVGQYIKTNPLKVWDFTRRWGAHPSSDLRAAIATCLLEHLLEHHFRIIFPLVERACSESRRFARTFTSCTRFGQANNHWNAKRWNDLDDRLGKN